jgi:DNA-binding LytR/AlgR family response regulator
MTLKSAEERTNNYPHIMRCHKSYMVNLKFVRDISGNAQGYKLHIPALNFPVPVSRSYQDRVLQALER